MVVFLLVRPARVALAFLYLSQVLKDVGGVTAASVIEPS